MLKPAGSTQEGQTETRPAMARTALAGLSPGEIKQDIHSEQEHFDRFYTERRASGDRAALLEAFKQRALHPRARPLDYWEYAFHLLGDVRGKTVLDLGCGGGWISRMLAAKGAQVVAFDVSLEGCRLTRDRLDGDGAPCYLVSMQDAHAMSLPSDRLDAVVVTGVLHHVSIRSVAAEIHRVLKPNGILVFYEPLRYGPWMWALRKLWLWLRGMKEDSKSEHEEALQDDDLAIFGDVFGDSLIRKFNFFAKTDRLQNRFGPLANTLRWIDFILLSVCPFLRRYCTAVVCRCQKRSPA